jgi:hypothetical protein
LICYLCFKKADLFARIGVCLLSLLKIVLCSENTQSFSQDIQYSKDLFTEHIDQHFSKDVLEALARKHKFVQRKSALDASRFVDMLMFSSGPANQLSLEDLANDFCEQHGITISKQGLHERFNDFSVEFMGALLKEQLSRQLRCVQTPEVYKHFKRIRIKDSTRYSVPKEYASVYKGQGGIGTPAQISIQYEYDLLSGQAIEMELTSACRNDQQDSRETLNSIEKGDLLIRDLAYASQAYIEHISSKEAFYLNRLNSKWKVFDSKGTPIDFSKILKKLKKYSLQLMELEVFIPINKQILSSRLIVSRVNDQTYSKRMCKARVAARSKGYKVTDNFKMRASLNTFITNIPVEWLAADQVRATYSLRWQIELIFKVWKSQGYISKIKAMKVQRFQCQLIARLLWLLLHWQALRIVQQHMETKCSPWKFYKVAIRLSNLLRHVILKRYPIEQWITQIMKKADKKYFTETNPQKPTTFDTLKEILA